MKQQPRVFLVEGNHNDHTELGMDTFNFWPVAGNELEQIRLFAQEVIPAAREQIEATRI